MNLAVMIKEMQALGYESVDASARVCQDIVLKAISKSSLSRNVTIKGGVLMRNMTQNIRRATQDMCTNIWRLSRKSIVLILHLMMKECRFWQIPESKCLQKNYALF